MSSGNESYVTRHSRRSFLKGLGCTVCMMTMGSQWVSKCDAGARSKTPARFYTPLGNKLVRCEICFRHCELEPGDIGHCEIRINQAGRMMTMGYGNPGAVNIDPIEKKPFFHFLPGTTAFSLATVGCNIDCKFCQNWQIAQAKPGDIQTRDMPPSAVAIAARKYKCPTIAFTYSEPTVWSEYVIDCAQEASKDKIRSVVVSNGTGSALVVNEWIKHLDAIKIDLKSIEPDYYKTVCNAELKPVLENIVRVKTSGVWLEIVNLVVTSLNDADENFRKLARWVKENVGPDVPVHFTRFHPMYRLKNLSPTPVERLDKAYEIAKAEGLHYVYVGNVPGHPAQNTICPKCGKIVIGRHGFWVSEMNIEDGKCKFCGYSIPGIWS